ncbi:MAG: helix-turn-helix transcriptional regulator, partial [Lachnospiraceae bacterium]|nr:helix-turn-helix transcriptional regulator [Lachnospiraceae bacterium]
MESNIKKTTIGYRIRLLRKKLNLSGEKFGEAIGLTRSGVSGYESGRREPTDSVIKLICKTWNVDYFWLTEGANVPMFIEMSDDIISDLAFEYSL